MTAVAVLRAAAETLRATAAEDQLYVAIGGSVFGAARPDVALALADWLDFHADMDERLHALVDGTPDLAEARWGGKPHPALALARLINPEETPDA